MRIYTLADAERIIANNLHRLRNFDTIIGVPRSGSIFAAFIATQLGCSLADVATGARSVVVKKHGYIVQEPLGRVLLMEDVVNQGNSLRECFEVLKQTVDIHRGDVTTCSVWTNPGSEPNCVDINLGGPHDPQYAFTWQMWHSARWSQWATDMDGVLCCDAPAEERTHEQYCDWAVGANARWRPLPKRVERYKIGAIITSRPEGIRKHTEDWLRRQGLQWKQLIMVPGNTESDVIKYLKDHHVSRAEWKAQMVALKFPACEMFIESDRRQACAISKRYPGLVWCTDSQERFRGGNVVTE